MFVRSIRAMTEVTHAGLVHLSTRPFTTVKRLMCIEAKIVSSALLLLVAISGRCDAIWPVNLPRVD